MAAQKATDDQIIQAWGMANSPSVVAAMLGVSVRNLQKRRQSIEAKIGRRLLTLDPLKRPAYDAAQMLHTEDRVEVKLTVKDGVILVGNDCHYHPSHVPTMHRAWCDLAQKLKPVAMVINGDALDAPTAGRWAPIGWEHRVTLKQEIDTIQDRLGELFHACTTARRVWTCGNHDARLNTMLAARVPEMRDMPGTELKDFFPEWTPAWFVTVNEGTESHTEIRHREKGGIHASYNNTKESGITIVTGHDHRADVVAYDDRRGRRYGVRTGMVADSPRDPQFVNYLEGRKVNWQSALGVLTYRAGMLLQPELALRVDDEHYQFRGELVKV